jgi:hypothetical protein
MNKAIVKHQTVYLFLAPAGLPGIVLIVSGAIYQARQ